MTIADDLRAAREAAALSQSALARACAEQAGGEADTWRQSIMRYERGDGEPGIATATAVAEALGLRLALVPTEEER